MKLRESTENIFLQLKMDVHYDALRTVHTKSMHLYIHININIRMYIAKVFLNVLQQENILYFFLYFCVHKTKFPFLFLVRFGWLGCLSLPSAFIAWYVFFASFVYLCVCWHCRWNGALLHFHNIVTNCVFFGFAFYFLSLIYPLSLVTWVFRAASIHSRQI